MCKHKYLFSEESFKLGLIKETVSITVCNTKQKTEQIISSMHSLVTSM